MPGAVYRIMPEQRVRWQVTREGDFVASTETREAAIEIARGRAISEQPARVVIHDRDGTVKEELTFGTESPSGN
jgi:Uncharacterized protein conserved in bacteria (DUF2188)